MRAFARDLIREGHYGQRPRVPRLKAEHMAAPTKPAKREESSCQLGAVHTLHFADNPSTPSKKALHQYRAALSRWCPSALTI
jgi:hypothetical protein